MNQYMSYNLSLENIDQFSLFKEKKNSIFSIYKTLKIKYINQYYKYHSLNKSVCRKDLIIAKIISLNFIKTIHKKNNSIGIKNGVKDENDTDVKRIKKKLNSNNYCKNLINNFMKNSNALIKPIMYEDTLYNNQKVDHKVEEISNNINMYKNNDFENKRFYYNNIKNSFNNNYKFNNFFKKENYFSNKNINFNNSFEKKLSPPFNIGICKTRKFNSLNDKKKELKNIKLDFNFLKENKIISNDIYNLSYNISNQSEKFLPNEDITKTKNFLKTIKKNKGRKAKNSKNDNSESMHTKFSSDNMMRKIKNKVIESSRLLANRIIKEESKNSCNIKFNLIIREFRKIQGSFSQELNIKFNCWFYQRKIKDIFSMEISNKYSTIEKKSNIELVNFIFSPLNEKNFIKTKVLLNTPFHQYYHDIFLNENKNWKAYYGIHENDQKYQIDYMIKNIKEEEREINNDNLKYIKDINYLAHHYEQYFLQKKPRNVDYNNKKNKYIKDFMNNLVNNEYLELCEELKQFKVFYEKRNSLSNKFEPNSLIVQKNDEILDNSLLIKNNNKSFILKNNNDIKKDIEYNNEPKRLFNNIIENTSTKNECIVNIISPEDEKLNSLFNGKICKNFKEKKSKDNIDELEKNKCQEKYICHKKRKRKIRHFIGCKKYKKDKHSNY